MVGKKKRLKFNVSEGELDESLRGCLLLSTSRMLMLHMVTLSVGTGIMKNRVGNKAKLRMQGTHIKTYDVGRESAEVSLVSNLGCNGKAPVRIELFLSGLNSHKLG